VGVLLDGPTCIKAFASVLEDIRASNFARLELVVFDASTRVADPQKQPRSWPARLWSIARSPQRRGAIGYSLYERLDSRLSRGLDDPLAVVDCSPLLEGVEVLSVEPIAKGFTHRFPPEAIEAIHARKLDVLLRFGFNILRGEVLATAKHGIWSFHHGDNDYYRGGPPLFWEVQEANPLSSVVLQVLTEQLDAGLVLCKGTFATVQGISVARNREAPYWGSTHFVIQKLYELHRYGWDFVARRAIPPRAYTGRKAIYRRPTNWELCRWLLPQIVTKAARRLIRRDTVDHWRIAIRVGPRRVYNPGGLADMQGFVLIEPPRGHYFADPFLHTQDGTTRVFFEDFDCSKGQAVIRWAQVSADGSLGEARICMDQGHHLSYPFVFTHEGQAFMVPESRQSRSVKLFRAAEYPTKWELDRVLMHDQEAVDVSLWIESGVCWWFVTAVEPRGRAPILLLFYSRGLGAEWVFHPANPISTDIRTSRCGGKPFRQDGRLIRVSQSGSPRYGHSFAFNEIIVMTPDEYEERTVATVGPDWSNGLKGTHTYNQCGDFEVVDACTARVRRSS